MLSDEPQSLRHLEFTCIHFELEFQEAVRLPPCAFLRLRRELLHLARFFDSTQGGGVLTALFDPALPSDPVARRRIQRPGPGFVIRGIPLTEHVFDIGDSFDLTVHFWGKALNYIAEFADILKMLGYNGLNHGRGLFDIVSIAAEDASGQRHLLQGPGEDLDELAPTLLDALWSIDSAEPVSPSALELRFMTPTRLLSQGRPLFRPTFSAILPFILRRVTSMALAHCDLELVEDPRSLLDAADRIRETTNTLQWTDWRRLEGESRSQDLGGITGALAIEGAGIQEIFWVLKLGSLLQVGKGAAYGAGRYDLRISS